MASTFTLPDFHFPTNDDEDYDGEDYEEGEWMYAENVIYSKSTFFCTDHKQSSPDSNEGQLAWKDELARRWKMRKALFPELGDDQVILGNFNQLYKVITFYIHILHHAKYLTYTL